MVAYGYGIFLFVFNSTSHIELNTQREIPYLRAPMYYSLFNELQKFKISNFLASYRTPARNLGLVVLRPQAGFAGVIHQWKRALYTGMFALVGMTIAALPKCRR